MSFVHDLREIQHQQLDCNRPPEAPKAQEFLPSKVVAAPSPQIDFDSPPSHAFLGIRLVQRYISESQFDEVRPPNCELLTITHLLSEVYPPAFTPPDYPNFIVWGIVAKRSEARETARGSKYVLMTLSDLKYDITLAVHGTGYEKYWKIRPGELVGVLNPHLYVQNGSERALGLSVNREKSIIELGQAKDLGQCEAIVSTTQRRCTNWVDRRKSSMCEFHFEQKVSRTSRPDLNHQGARLWDPKQSHKGTRNSQHNNNIRMSVTKGGAVKWKRGLQLDNQALVEVKDRSVHPNAPIGKVYSSSVGGPDVNDRFTGQHYDRPIETDQKRLKREVREREDLKREARIKARLAARPDAKLVFLTNATPKSQGSSDQSSSELGNAFKPEDLRRIGFNPTGGSRLANSGRKLNRLPVSRPNADDSDDDLDIVDR